MFAIVDFQWHQYIVAEGQELVVDKVAEEEGADVEIAQVLAVFDEKGSTVEIGQPVVKKAKVVAQVVSHQKGKKIRVIKFKNKNRYMRTKGFRPHQTVLKIKSVTLNG